jgi:predicted PhzF superfamily epimerase YddE/YHI9
MNLSETAFITPTEEPDVFGLRWWTPGHEVALCGHATVASTAVLAAHPTHGSVDQYRFQTLSGELVTKKITKGDGSEVYELDFPATPATVVEGGMQDDKYTGPLKTAFGSKFQTVHKIWKSKFDLIVEVKLEDDDHLGDWKVEMEILVSLVLPEVVPTATLIWLEYTLRELYPSEVFV